VSNTSTSSTSPSLLWRLQNTADEAWEEAWAEFVRRYGPRLYGWCRRWQLQESDAQDVIQTVLYKLVIKMQTFAYDPARSFRAYLKTLAKYAWYALLRKGDRECVDGSGVREVLANAEACDDLERQLVSQFQQELLEVAKERVRGRVEAHTWEAFRLTALEAMSGAEVAGRLGIQVATVFQAKTKVIRMLREEVTRLDPP
jgi:RNA polymerase sigma-70 factor (ECF subfamily)